MDEKVVKDLFTQLNLAPPAPSSAAPAAPAKPATVPEKAKQDPKQQPTETSQVDAMAKKQEERKDKIARLLAEKKAKAAAGASTQPKNPLTPVPAGIASPSVKPKTQSEKNLLLQQKMEALRKAQEARAQKASQQPTTPQVSRPEVAEKEVTRPSTQGPTMTAQPTTEPQPPAASRPPPAAITLSHDGPKKSPLQPTLKVQSPALPGLSNKPINQRKRPVAADFVDYPPQAIKRAFLPARQDSSLVISVSDDEEEDDDDIDMEVDSPTEDSSASAQQSFSLPGRAPTLRDYPPLTNRGAPRQLSTPASGTPGRTAIVDLKAQEKAIAELKRRIEEAEARAKAKPKNGSSTPQTPSAGDATPIDQAVRLSERRTVSTNEMDDKNGPSAQLLQEAEAAKLPNGSALLKADRQPKAERRSRLSSAQTPNMTAIVDEKVARIRRMEEELNRLRAEVDESLAQEPESEVDEGSSESAADSVQAIQDIKAAATSYGEPDRMQSDEASLDGASQSHPMEIESSDRSDDEMESPRELYQAGAPEIMGDVAASGPETYAQDSESVKTAQLLMAGQPVESLTVIANATPAVDAMSAAEDNASDDYEPPDAPNDDQTAADSPPFSPAPADNAEIHEMSRREAQELIPPMPTQISTADMPNDDPTTEAHAEFFAHPSSRVEEIPREVHVVSSFD